MPPAWQVVRTAPYVARQFWGGGDVDALEPLGVVAGWESPPRGATSVVGGRHRRPSRQPRRCCTSGSVLKLLALRAESTDPRGRCMHLQRLPGAMRLFAACPPMGTRVMVNTAQRYVPLGSFSASRFILEARPVIAAGSQASRLVRDQVATAQVDRAPDRARASPPGVPRSPWTADPLRKGHIRREATPLPWDGGRLGPGSSACRGCQRPHRDSGRQGASAPRPARRGLGASGHDERADRHAVGRGSAGQRRQVRADLRPAAAQRARAASVWKLRQSCSPTGRDTGWPWTSARSTPSDSRASRGSGSRPSPAAGPTAPAAPWVRHWRSGVGRLTRGSTPTSPTPRRAGSRSFGWRSPRTGSPRTSPWAVPPSPFPSSSSSSVTIPTGNGSGRCS